jgi:dihydrofolate synthase/folylpolyglutamate synthase
MDKIRSVSAEVISPSQDDILYALQYVPPPFNGNLALAVSAAKRICKKNIAYDDYPLPPCRQERFGRIILDGAHNAAGILTLKNRFPHIGGVLISSTKERDIKRFIRLLSGCTKNIIVTSIPDNPRSIDASDFNGIIFIEDPINALKELEARTGGDILVTGSLYLCSFVRNVLGKRT